MASASQKPAGQTPRSKILRIGVILGGKIVEERLIRDHGNVTIGQSAKNTFGVPSAELPKTWTLFQAQDGRYALNIAQGMDGRLSDNGQVQTLSQLVSSGQAKKAAAGHQLPLTDAARGKVMLGELTLLFQFVMAPPVQPKPQLPHSVRGRISDRIDPYMALILFCSLLFHGSVLTWLYNKDMPRPTEPDEIPDRFGRVLLERPVVPEPTKADDGPTQVEKGPDEPAKGEGKDKDKGDKGDKGEEKPKGPDQAAVARAVENTAVLKVLGARSSAGTGRFVDVTGGKDAGGDLDKGLQNVGKSGVAIAGPGGPGGSVRGGGDGTIGTGSATGVSGPTGGGGAGDKTEREIKVDVRTTELEDIASGGLDPSSIMKTIKTRYYIGIQRCYQSALKTNPKLAGKLSINFVIGGVGKVTSAKVSGFDPGVDACVKDQAMRWRFQKPEDGDAEFDIGFILRPGA